MKPLKLKSNVGVLIDL